jgi:hypothetical protein
LLYPAHALKRRVEPLYRQLAPKEIASPTPTGSGADFANFPKSGTGIADVGWQPPIDRNYALI